MSWWNAKYKNNHGEYEITFASKDYEEAKAVEKVCCAVMDKAVKYPFDVEVVVRCGQCKFDNLCCRNVGKDGKRTKYDFCSYGERKEGADNV